MIFADYLAGFRGQSSPGLDLLIAAVLVIAVSARGSAVRGTPEA